MRDVNAEEDHQYTPKRSEDQALLSILGAVHWWHLVAMALWNYHEH